MTPRSKFSLEQLGLELDKLYKISKKEYLENNIELKKENPEILDKRYEHFEKRRNENIEKVRQLRKEIIENNILESNNNNSNLPNISNKPNVNSNKIENENESKLNTQAVLTQENEIIRKELEKLELLKKQQLY